MRFFGFGRKKGPYEARVIIHDLPVCLRRHLTLEFIEVNSPTSPFPSDWKSPAIPSGRRKNCKHILDFASVNLTIKGKQSAGYYYVGLLGFLIREINGERRGYRQDFFMNNVIKIEPDTVTHLELQMKWPSDDEMEVWGRVGDLLDEGA